MRERPVLFKGEMVRAILDGKKTQTRRAFKGLLPADAPARIGVLRCEAGWGFCDTDGEHHRCPYGGPGDRLWVRETWHHGDSWYADGPALAWKNCRRDGECTWVDYAATFDAKDDPRSFAWKPSIHMPRWASRLTLEVTGVRVERLQGISEEDAAAEGVTLPPCSYVGRCNSGRCPLHGPHPHVNAYRVLWESINGPGSWDLNPYVWVVSFRYVEVSP